MHAIEWVIVAVVVVGVVAAVFGWDRYRGNRKTADEALEERDDVAAQTAGTNGQAEHLAECLHDPRLRDVLRRRDDHRERGADAAVGRPALGAGNASFCHGCLLRPASVSGPAAVPAMIVRDQ